MCDWVTVLPLAVTAVIVTVAPHGRLTRVMFLEAFLPFRIDTILPLTLQRDPLELRLARQVDVDLHVLLLALAFLVVLAPSTPLLTGAAATVTVEEL